MGASKKDKANPDADEVRSIGSTSRGLVAPALRRDLPMDSDGTITHLPLSRLVEPRLVMHRATGRFHASHDRRTKAFLKRLVADVLQAKENPKPQPGSNPRRNKWRRKRERQRVAREFDEAMKAYVKPSRERNAEAAAEHAFVENPPSEKELNRIAASSVLEPTYSGKVNAWKSRCNRALFRSFKDPRKWKAFWRLARRDRSAFKALHKAWRRQAELGNSTPFFYNEMRGQTGAAIKQYEEPEAAIRIIRNTFPWIKIVWTPRHISNDATMPPAWYERRMWRWPHEEN